MTTQKTPRLTLDGIHNAIEYLACCGALTPRRGMPHVWLDYLTRETPQARDTDLADACAHAVTEWAKAGRKWQTGVTHLADAIRTIRWARVKKSLQTDGPLYGEHHWCLRVQDHLADGLTRTEAEKAATTHHQPAKEGPHRHAAA